jgi:hypothetical protein
VRFAFASDKYIKETTMKINEIISQAQRPTVVQPTVVKQQARVANVVGQIAASDAKQAPTEMDKVMAMRRYADIKKRTNKNYAERLRQQLANVQAAAR